MDSLPNEEPIYTTTADKPPLEVGDCLRNRFILKQHLALDMAYDESTGVVRLTKAWSNDVPLQAWYMGVWVSPDTDAGSLIELRTYSMIANAFDEEVMVDIIDSCRRA